MKPETRNPNPGAPSSPDPRSDRAFSLQPPAFSLCLLLALVTLLVYLPARQHDFVSYDDPVYVTSNRYVQAGLTWAGVRWALVSTYAGNWHPLTWLSHMLDVQLFGPGPMGPHLVNVLFHAANTVLLFVLLRRLTGALWRSALVAALFALHPLHVESVAWVAERKDVLSGFFFLLTLLAYAHYVERSKVQSPRSKVFYWLAWLGFALGLMSKPMLVTLPLVLLLLDYWPLKRFTIYDTDSCRVFAIHRSLHFTLWPLVREKIPFLLLSAMSCAVTYGAQKEGGAVRTLASFSMGERVGNALVSCARYLGKTFWPADLAVLYPHPGHWPPGQVVLAAILVGGLCLGALRIGRRFPFVATGWFWFLGMLIPTIGLVQVGNQSMADRYTYLPSIGVFIILAWGAGEAFVRWRLPKAVIGIATGLVLIACAVRTGDQLRYWQNSESLFRHAIALTQGNFLAHNNLGNALLDRKQVDEAIMEFHKALEIKPDYADAHVNLGNALLAQKRVEEAMTQFQTALQIQPGSAEAHYNLGNVLLQKGRTDEAILHFRRAAEISPDHVMARNNLANTLLQKGQVDEAILYYRAALEIRPDFVVARHNLGTALLQKGQTNEAIAQFRSIVELQPSGANTLNNLGWALRQAGQLDEAVAQLTKALEIRPDYPEAHGNLAKTLALKGQVREAVAHYRTALKLQPDDPQNLSELAWLLATWPEASFRNGTEAIELARKADQLSNGRDPAALRVLAAAYAEGGQFAEAVSAARRALELAESNAVFAEELRSELKLYEAGAPVRAGLTSENRNPKSE